MKNIVITGGSDGLGKELAKQLSLEGHTVTILAPNTKKVESAAAEISCSFQVCDISDWEAVEAAITATIDKCGSIDVLINNAGVAYGGRLEQASPESIQRSFDVNVVGVLFVTKAVIPIMKRAGDGYIININSQGGLYTKAERALYNGSKWAVTGITKVLQAELADSNIKVTGIYPGALERSMLSGGQRDARENGVPYEDIIDGVKYILSRNPSIAIPELGVTNVEY